MFPDVDDQHLAGSEGEQSTLAFKVLILASFATIGALDVHDEDVPSGLRLVRILLVLGHPDSLGGLSAIRLDHDTKVRAEEMIEQRRLPRRLRAEDGDEVVAEAGGGDILPLEVIR